MRNRVALKVAHTAAMTSKLVLVMVLVPVALVATAQGASATTLADSDLAAESSAFGFLGPVGIGAVVLGFGGLVAGLLRHRRREATASVSADSGGGQRALDTTQQVEPADGERVA